MSVHVSLLIYTNGIRVLDGPDTFNRYFGYLGRGQESLMQSGLNSIWQHYTTALEKWRKMFLAGN